MPEQQRARFALHVRIPAWAEGASVRVNGSDVSPPAGTPGAYALHRARVADGRYRSRCCCRCARRSSKVQLQRAGVARPGRRADQPGSDALRLPCRQPRSAGVRDRPDRRLQERGNDSRVEASRPTRGSKRLHSRATGEARVPIIRMRADRPRAVVVRALLPCRRPRGRALAPHLDVAGAGMIAMTHRLAFRQTPRRYGPAGPSERRARARSQRLHRRAVWLHAAGRPGRRGDQDRAARWRQPAQVSLDAAGREPRVPRRQPQQARRGAGPEAARRPRGRCCDWCARRMCWCTTSGPACPSAWASTTSS